MLNYINLKKLTTIALLSAVATVSCSFSKSSLSFATDVTSSVTPVSVELVLAVDVSTSINATEFGLQHNGYINAFKSEEVKNAIKELPNGLAVTMMFWSSNRNAKVSRYDIGWYKLAKNSSGTIDGLPEFVSKLESISREVISDENRITIGTETIVIENGTDLAHAITASKELLDSNNYTGDNSVIDVSGDGFADDTPIDSDDIAYVDTYISNNNLSISNYLTGRTKCNYGHIGDKVEANEVEVKHVFCPPVLEARKAAVDAGIKINGLPIVATSSNADREDEVDRYYQNNVVGGDDAFYITATFETFSQAITQKISCEIQDLNCFFAD
ncbi:DUF1194 domain-containing protein [Myxosarcina sp. GI1]|uniref:DUF1194 domain-containing protein n=1 Tax=Myxosarcina sp. GI1 TaxID=1541065 RepID=UPI00055EC258|nr:DUF1194 domain-containing protein [Myxosarcina sp. GI1]